MKLKKIINLFILTLAILGSFNGMANSTVRHATASKSPTEVAPNPAVEKEVKPAPTPVPTQTPVTEVKEEPSVPHHHFFLGASGTNFEIFYSKDTNTTTRFNLAFGYIPTVHHQINVTYGHEPSSIFSSTLTGVDVYGVQYRYLLTEKMEHSFYLQPNFNIYRINGNKVINTDSSYISYGITLGKNFTIFESDSFVFSPSISYEKVEKQEARFRFTPIAFGLYFF